VRLTTSTKLKLAYVGLAAVDTWLSGIADKKAHYARFVTKPLLMPTLTASLVTNPKAADSPLRTSTVAAQLGGWGGDVALLGEGTKPFLVGAGSFGLGHVAYLTGFVRQHGHSGIRDAAGPRAVAGSWAGSFFLPTRGTQLGMLGMVGRAGSAQPPSNAPMSPMASSRAFMRRSRAARRAASLAWPASRRWRWRPPP